MNMTSLSKNEARDIERIDSVCAFENDQGVLVEYLATPRSSPRTFEAGEMVIHDRHRWMLRATLQAGQSERAAVDSGGFGEPASALAQPAEIQQQREQVSAI